MNRIFEKLLQSASERIYKTWGIVPASDLVNWADWSVNKCIIKYVIIVIKQEKELDKG